SSAASDVYKRQVATCEALKVQLESARQKLSYTRITSPMDGLVMTKDITEGCLISNTMVPYVIMNSDTVEAVISVTEQVINKIRKGEKLDLTVPSISDKSLEGVVSSVSPAVDPKTMTYTVSIEIANPKGSIKPGMTAKVGIITEKHDQCVIAPLSSILSSEGRNYVYTVHNQSAEKTPVTTGIIDGDRVEILEGLDEGDLLVVKGQQYLRQNDSITITEEVSQ
ncbi:MAG: efflux RND transporter periplasmic adaptor subunit, partial [Clostridia bacterium]|nr:efflux RND transporter periplasmic adaptor subunit [Clostridia bacterium]